MRHAIISALPVLLAACTADLIRHDAGAVLGDSGVTRTDAATADASEPEDATVVDSGPRDVGSMDVGPADGGTSGCQLVVTPTEVTFPLTQVGATNTATVLVQNVGFAECNASAWAQPRGAGFTVTPPWGAILQPGNSDQFTVAFSPTAPGKAGAAAVAGTLETQAYASLSGEAYLPEVASTREVIFQVRNTTGADRYLVLEGRDCVGLDPAAPQMLSFQCGCECPPPPAPGPTRLLRVAPGNTQSMRWSARSLTTWQVPEICGPDHSEILTHGALAPVPDGTYPTRIAFERNLPSFCTATSDPDVFDCDPIGGTGDLPPVIAPLCETDSFVQTLVMVGPNDVTVPVDITD